MREVGGGGGGSGEESTEEEMENCSREIGEEGRQGMKGRRAGRGERKSEHTLEKKDEGDPATTDAEWAGAKIGGSI